MATEYLFPGATTWTPPAGVTSISYAMWGGGGAGGAKSTDSSGGGGAGTNVGLCVNRDPTSLSVVIVGSGAVSGLDAYGQDTLAGGGGQGGVTGGQSGMAASTGTPGNGGYDPTDYYGTNDFFYLGQAGGNGVTPDIDPGGTSTKPIGGHAANSDGDWNAGAANDGGAGGFWTNDGGFSVANQPTSPGGGGVGGAAGSGTTPGNGADGLIQIDYTLPSTGRSAWYCPWLAWLFS